jgi:cell pole-organizing protein PopZ
LNDSEFARLEMALKDPQAEPSMEEILASIRRIISEEEQPSEPVLDLTEAHADAPAAAEDDLVFEAVETIAAPAPATARPASPQPAAVAAPAPKPAPVVRAAVEQAPVPETIISPPTASATAGALARLAGSLRIAEAPGQTVEGVVRELLKPMLKEWLDHNLPAIVESRVEAELERIARLAR